MLAALVAAVGDWVAVARGSKRLEYVFKPLTLVLLIVAAVFLREGDPPARWWFTLAALAFSVAGDIFLMLPRDRFVAGLASFLVAHVCYVVAFNAPPVRGVAAWVIATVAAAVALAAAPVYLRLREAIAGSGRRELLVPITVYVAAIAAMAFFALLTVARPDWNDGRGALAAGGALLFFSSDGMIGWSRFVGDFPGSRILIIVTYHLGQAGLVLGLLGVG